MIPAANTPSHGPVTHLVMTLAWLRETGNAPELHLHSQDCVSVFSSPWIHRWAVGTSVALSSTFPTTSSNHRTHHTHKLVNWISSQLSLRRLSWSWYRLLFCHVCDTFYRYWKCILTWLSTDHFHHLFLNLGWVKKWRNAETPDAVTACCVAALSC